MLKELRGNTVVLLVGIGAFAFGAYTFAQLAVLPRFGAKSS